MIATRLDRYLGRRILTATALVLAVLAALTVFFTVVDVLPDYGKGSFRSRQLVLYVVLSQARKLYELFPMATLIGTLIGLSGLALNSELIAMRAAGVSIGRIVWGAAKTGLLLIVAAALFGEFVVPVAENAATLGRARAMAASLQQKGSDIWLRDGTRFVNIGEVLPDLSLLRVTLYETDERMRLVTRTAARRASFHEGVWRLHEVRQHHYTPAQVRQTRSAELSWSSSLTPEMVRVFSVKPESLSVLQLSQYIEHLRQNSQETANYRLAFWQKLFLPLATAVMMLIAAPFVFRHHRGGGMSQRIFIGVMLGLTFVVLNRSFGYLGLIYGLPPLLGAGLPILLFFFAALLGLRRAG